LNITGIIFLRIIVERAEMIRQIPQTRILGEVNVNVETLLLM